MQSVLSSVGLRPDAIVGHSTGEYSALLASGAAQVENDHHLVDHILEGNRATERAQVAGLVPDGVLLAVGPADPDLIEAGSHEAVLTISFGDAATSPTQTLTALMSRPEPARLEASPKSILFGTALLERRVALWNVGIGTVDPQDVTLRHASG